MGNDEYQKYLGKICPYCKTEFVEGDEIVLCSDCEMPHHKECFIENKGCTTFGCQGSMRSLIVTSAPVIDIEVIESKVDNAITQIDKDNIDKNEKEELYKIRLNEYIYDEILNKLSLIREPSNNINDLITMNKLINELKKLGDFKDSIKKVDESILKLNRMGNYLLDNTKLQLDCTDKISLVKIGIRRYKKINEIVGVDVSEYEELANKRIEIIEKDNRVKENEEREKILKKEEKQKFDKEQEVLSKNKMKKNILFSIPILIVLIITIILFKLYFSKKEYYDIGLNYLNDGKYSEAIIEFEKSNGYSKAEYYIDYCKKMLHYLRGKELVDEGNFSSALNEFELSRGVEDSDEFIKYCEDKLNGGE